MGRAILVLLSAVPLVLLAGACNRDRIEAPASPAPAVDAVPDYRIFINYELGMHCTGFDFSYCCILPPYNSIQAQVVRVGDPPLLLDQHAPDDPTVLVEPDTGRRLRLRYSLDDNTFSEGAKLLYWGAPYDADGNGRSLDPGDVVANAYWTHLYVYDDLDGGNSAGKVLDQDKRVLGRDLTVPRDAGPAGQRLSSRRGQPMYLRHSGATGTRVWTKSPVLDNTPIVLTNPGIWEALGLPLTPFLDSSQFGKPFHAIEESDVQPFQVARVTLVDAASDTTVLGPGGRPVSYTGTEPIDVPNCANCHANTGGDPRHDGEPVRVRVGGELRDLPELVAMERAYWLSVGASEWMAGLKGAAISILGLHDAHHGTGFLARSAGTATGSGNRLGRDPVLCQKCHADNVVGVLASAGIVAVDAAGAFLFDLGDQGRIDHFAVVDYANRDAAYQPDRGRQAVVADLRPEPDGPQFTGYLTRLRAAAALPHRNDRNLPARAVAATTGPVAIPTLVLPPLTEALHDRHLAARPLFDGAGRSGACQGCHPAHRYDRSLTAFPITPDGRNPYANGDNRDAAGGCFVGRDVHSNPGKDRDGAATPEHLNAIGRWLQAEVSRTGADADGDGLGDTIRGLWCTNCHSEVSRALYRADRLRPGHAFTATPAETLRDDSLDAIATALGLSVDGLKQALDPRGDRPSPFGYPGSTALRDPWQGAGVRATAPIAVVGDFDVVDGAIAGTTVNGIAGSALTPVTEAFGMRYASPAGTTHVAVDREGDVVVNLLSADPDDLGRFSADRHPVAPPYDAASDGRDYWLAAGEPHCADCHAAPFVEGQGGVAFPINQPGHYSLMRYAKGHAGLACQACHESSHGLYPVTPDIDPTTYAQAAALNPDGSHGPIRCAACHQPVNAQGVPVAYADLTFRDIETDKEAPIGNDFDLAVQFIHATAPDQGGR